MLFTTPPICMFPFDQTFSGKISEFLGFIPATAITLPPVPAATFKLILNSQKGVSIDDKQIVLIYADSQMMNRLSKERGLIGDMISVLEGGNMRIWFTGIEPRLSSIVDIFIRQGASPKWIYTHTANARDEQYIIAKNPEGTKTRYTFSLLPGGAFVDLN